MALLPPDLAAAGGGGGGGESAGARLPLSDRGIVGGRLSAGASSGVVPAMKDLTFCSTGKSTTPITGTPGELAPNYLIKKLPK